MGIVPWHIRGTPQRQSRPATPAPAAPHPEPATRRSRRAAVPFPGRLRRGEGRQASPLPAPTERTGPEGRPRHPVSASTTRRSTGRPPLPAQRGRSGVARAPLRWVAGSDQSSGTLRVERRKWVWGKLRDVPAAGTESRSLAAPAPTVGRPRAQPRAGGALGRDVRLIFWADVFQPVRVCRPAPAPPRSGPAGACARGLGVAPRCSSYST